MEQGVLVLNSSLTPVIANPVARRILQLGDLGLPPSVGPEAVVSIARRCMSDGEDVVTDVRLGQRDIEIRAVPLDEGAAMFLRDVTEELSTQQLRRQFAANASHELKTPLASLGALVEALQTSRDDPDATQRFTDRLGVEVSRLNSLIGHLMDLSRVEDPAAMRIERVDVSGIVLNQVGDIEAQANEKDIRLMTDVGSGISIRGDQQHLVLLVRNLLDNAIRYTSAGGLVQVSLTAEGATARLVVRDEGIGIPLGAQSRIFERFFRVDEDRARLSGGTGLGLSIVKNVAESHGGSVGVLSELDEGSTFTVVLPLLDA
jgi:two-component system sensor histidine kinase SenX3